MSIGEFCAKLLRSFDVFQKLFDDPLPLPGDETLRYTDDKLLDAVSEYEPAHAGSVVTTPVPLGEECCICPQLL